MPAKKISFTNFDRRLVLAGGRESAVGGLRRASGIAPELTTSVLSRWGSTQLYHINAIQLYYWNGVRYQYDGTTLWKNGVSIKAGFDGARLTFNSMPPQPGIQDYLFILGGGVAPFKIDPSGNITNWGIVAPPNQMNVANLPNEQIVIDNFDASSANYAHVNAALSDEATIVAIGAGSMKINPGATTAWSATQAYGAAQNWGQYGSGDFSLETDIFQIWFYIDSYPAGVNTIGTWLEIDVDVNDQTFKKDWYSIAIGLIPSTTASPRVKRNVNFDITFQVGQWQQITIAKSQWIRNGTNTQLDWSMVQALRFKGGNVPAATNIYVDNFTLSGGSAMGAGPAAGNGGSEYDYYTVYRNLTTGSQSNPQANPIKLFGVSVNQTKLTNIPLSLDPQVGARDLYRTSALNQAGGGTAFFLDTLYDNTTTTYIDSIADSPVPLITTPWTASIVVPPSSPTHPSAGAYFIDGGNGYYFKLTTPGTTGAAPPAWKVPSTQWSAVSAFFVGETTSQPRAAGVFWQATNGGVSGTVEPDWTLPGPLIDGTVSWAKIGLQVIVDNTARWTFAGINATRTLGVNALMFDNAPPQPTYGDAWGPFEGSMFWTRDSSRGAAGYVYASPPGRPESVSQSYLVSSTDDPMQKVVSWDSALWALSTSRAFKGNGSAGASLGLDPLSQSIQQALGSTAVLPVSAFDSIDDALGTLKPFTVVPVQQIGIIYWAPDGVRVLNWSGSKLLGFQALAPIFRGQTEEDVPAWNEETGPLWAESARNEIVFSDGTTLTIGLTYDGLTGDGPTWRLPGQILTALYYEHQTGETVAAWGGDVYEFEDSGVLTDGGAVIPFELQSPGDMPDIGQRFVGQRLYITMNPNVSAVPQIITPTLIIDENEIALPPITATKRTTFSIPIYAHAGRFFDGVRLSGNLTGRVEILRIEAAVWLGGQG